MIDLDNLPKHAMLETVVDDLCPQDDPNRHAYRVLAGFFFSKMASAMQAVISGESLNAEVPVNCFATLLAPSGWGKNTAVGNITRNVVKGFQKRFTGDTMPICADQHMMKLAIEKSIVTGRTEEEEKARFDKGYEAAGPYPFTTKRATASAIEQLRGKLLMASIGAINIQIDEIGSNITDKYVAEGLDLFLELYDMGHTDMALTKNTNDNVRVDEIEGFTPANLLMFGTPSKLFDGGQAEQAFMSLLDTGYARRLLFAWGVKTEAIDEDDFAAIYAAKVQKKNAITSGTHTKHFNDLADVYKYGWNMELPADTGILYEAYSFQCRQRVKEISPHMDIQRTEMEHRPWKALKLAGALAFIDESLEVTENHFLSAVGIVEDSGKAMRNFMNPEKAHVKLAKYLGDAAGPVTHADLVESLPFYPKSAGPRTEMMTLAMAWGYKNNVIVRKTYEDGIEFFEGDQLSETNLNELILSHSDHQAYNYGAELAPFEQMEILLSAPDRHWCNHRFEEGHRLDTKTIQGFNMVVVDVDGGTTLDFVQQELAEYNFITSTTKRHDPDGEHRFRLILPISHHLSMDAEEYDEFMANVLMWLPFESDKGARQRNKKWLTNPDTEVFVNEGQTLNALPFIPKTSKNEQFHKEMEPLANVDNLERWFAGRYTNGDRNNLMARFAFALVGEGMGYSEVEQRVLMFNQRLSNGLEEDELRNSVLKSAARKIAEAA